jgi:hypothetical protein
MEICTKFLNSCSRGFGYFTYLTNLLGSGALSNGSNPLMLSPRKEGTSIPSMISVGLDLGLNLVNGEQGKQASNKGG